MNKTILLTSILTIVPFTQATEIGQRQVPSNVSIQQHENTPVADQRVLISMPDHVKSFFLESMRQNLSAINQVHHALATSKFDQAAIATENSMGLGGITTHNALSQSMPKEMQALGMGFHHASSQLATALREKNKSAVLGALAAVTDLCVMCHSMYRVN